MRKVVFNAALLISGLGCFQITWAACTPNKGFRTLDIAMNVGRVVVRPSDPVGSVLRKASFPIIPNGSTSYCDMYASIMIAQLDQSYPASPAGGDGVYGTNIPGIGVRLYREAQDNTYFSGYYPYQRNLNANSTYSLSPGYFVVEIIKIAANTGSGAFVPGRYSSYYMRGYSHLPDLTSTVYGNAITIASSSCEIQGNPNRVIELSPVTTSDFRGIGTTLAEQAFDMSLLCNGGASSGGYLEKNFISVSYDYQQYANNNQVISNIANPGSRAGGVGLQLLWNDASKEVIKNKQNFQLGTVNSNQSLQFNIPMLARYYQTDNNVTAGQVKGIATVTVEYN